MYLNVEHDLLAAARQRVGAVVAVEQAQHAAVREEQLRQLPAQQRRRRPRQRAQLRQRLGRRRRRRTRLALPAAGLAGRCCPRLACRGKWLLEPFLLVLTP